MKAAQIIKKIGGRFQGATPAMKASMAYMVCSFLQKGISILTTPIFTRLLTTEQYGYYSVYNSWLAAVKIFSTLMLAGTVYMQAVVKFREDKEKMTSAVAGLGTMTTLVVAAVYFLFRDQLNRLMQVDTLIMTCILITAWEEMMLDFWAVQQRVEHRFKALVLLTLATSLIKPVLGMVCVISTDVWKAQVRILSSVAVDVMAYSWFFVHYIRKGRQLFDRKYWKYFLAFGIPLVPHFLTRILLNQSDKVMIQMMVGYSAAGIYSLAHNLAWMLTLVTQAVLNTLSPWIFQRIRDREFGRIARISYITSAVVAAAGLMLTAVAPEVVKIFAPADYYDAIWIIPPLVASVYFTFLYSLFADFEYYYEAKKYILAASLLGGVINIGLNYLFIRLFGYLAAGYTTLICFVFLAGAHYWSMKRILRGKEPGVKVYSGKTVIALSGVFMAAQFVCMLTYPLPWVRYGLLAAGCAVMIWQRKRILQPLAALRKK